MLLQQLFERQVSLTPERVAVAFGSETLSYRELDRLSTVLAAKIRSVVATEDNRVVCVGIQKCPAFYVAILAVLKASAAFVPFDLSFPVERLEFMARESDVRLVLISTATKHRVDSIQALSGVPQIKVCLDILSNCDFEEFRCPCRTDPSDLAYIVFTSGSTGKPKGVMIEHGAISNTIQVTVEVLHYECGDRALAFFNVAFDGCISETFCTLCSGATLVVPEEDWQIALCDKDVNLVQMTPSALSVLNPADFANLEKILVAGEACSYSLAQKWLASSDTRLFVNAYGPSETAVIATAGRLQLGATVAHIGVPLRNYEAYVLDSELKRVSVGVAGELHVGGMGVARGYLNRPDLTAVRFLPNPFGQGKLYKTGDLVRWLPDGNLEFLGRIDRQVKLRGFRVELGEIESVLVAQPGVTGAVVVKHHERLVAFVTPSDVNVAALEESCPKSLPNYMIPAMIVAIDEFARTGTGKIDLQRMEGMVFSSMDMPSKNTFEEAVDLREESVLQALKYVIGTAHVRLADDFVALGGDSLKAIQLANHLRSMLKVDIRVADIFENPTPRALLQFLSSTASQSSIPALQSSNHHSDQCEVIASFAQQRLWIVDQLHPHEATYSIPWVMRLQGAVDEQRLLFALRKLVVRHAPLRTALCDKNGVLMQVLLPEDSFVPRVVDLRQESCPSSSLNVALDADINAPFDLSEGVFRATLYHMAENDWALSMCIHHCSFDGASAPVFLRDLSALYNGNRLEDLPVQYVNFTMWERDWLTTDVIQRQLEYWRAALDGAPTTLELPADRPRGARVSHRGSHLRLVLEPTVRQGVEQMASELRITPFAVLLSAFGVILCHHASVEDVLVASPFANRRDDALRDLVGFFANTLPLRVDVRGNVSFREVVQLVWSMLLGAFDNQDVPFDRLVDGMNLARDQSRELLCQVMLIQQAAEGSRCAFGDLDVHRMEAYNNFAKFELVLEISPCEDFFVCVWEYCMDLFEAATVRRIHEHLEVLIKRLAADASMLDCPVWEISVLPESERRLMVDVWNSTSVPLPVESCVHCLFQKRASIAPSHAALLFGEDQQAVTYGQLDAMACHLASRIADACSGLNSSHLVGVCVERGRVEQVVAVLGILYSGTGFVPLDPSDPIERLRFLIEDSGMQLVVTTTTTQGLLPTQNCIRLLAVDYPGDFAKERRVSSPMSRCLASGKGVCEVTYTSGSSGHPKGVPIHHEALCNLSSHYLHALDLSPSDRVFFFHRLPFIDAARTLFAALCSGATLVLWRDDWTRVLAKASISVLFIIPSALIGLDPSQFPSLRAIVASGEACPLSVVRSWAPGRQFFNAYGSTEVTADCSLALLMHDCQYVSIGRPLSNCSVFVLRPNTLRAVPIGVFGELCVGGVGVCSGYFQHPALTERCFVPNPFGNGFLFRTGDLGRWLPDGNLEFLGRIDRQVKLRGFRVELGEIESVLVAQPGVTGAVVVKHHERLVAFVTPSDVSVIPLESTLKRVLPGFMVPSAILRLSELPHLPSGKTDMVALRHHMDSFVPLQQARYILPSGPAEETLITVFESVLHVRDLGMADDFVALGGDSLKAIQLANHLRSMLKVDIRVADIFDNPTPRALLQLVTSAASQSSIPALQSSSHHSDQCEVIASFAQQRLWIVDQLHPHEATYSIPWVMRLQGAVDEQRLLFALRKLVVRHAPLRTALCDKNGVLMQVMLPEDSFVPRVVDLRQESCPSLSLNVALDADINAPFDLSEGVFRATLYHVTDNDWALSMCIHHIAIDMNSFDVFLRDLSTLYDERILEDLPVQYVDFAMWQRDWLTTDVIQRQLEYWRAALDGAPTTLELPADRPRGARVSHRGSHLRLVLEPTVRQGVEQMASELRITPFAVLLSAFGVILCHHASVEDVLVASPFANRRDDALRDLVGFFANTLPLRVDVRGNVSFREVLQRVWSMLLGAFDNQDVPFDRLVDGMNLARDQSRELLCQVLFVMQPFVTGPKQSVRDGPDTSLRPAFMSLIQSDFDDQLDFRVSKYDLLLQVFPSTNDYVCHWEYCTDLFEEATIGRMHEHLEVLLRNLVEAKADMLDCPVWEVNILPEPERHLIVDVWNDTEIPRLPENDCLHWMFEKQAVRNPSHVALLLGDEKLSYGELNEQANCLARVLCELRAVHGRLLQRDEVIGVLCPRSFVQIVALLGILKAGGGYLPLDPELPASRLDYMIHDSKVQCVVWSGLGMDAVTAEIPALQSILLLPLDEILSGGLEKAAKTIPDANGGDSDTFHRTAVTPDQIAYVIYTSGSSGQPKGVICEHGGISNGIQHWMRRLALKPEDRVLQFHHICFDVSVEEIFVTLCSGSTLVLWDRDWVGAVESSGVTILHMIPSALEVLDPTCCSRLRAIILGGETFSMDLVKRWYAPNRLLINGYGPTEAFYSTEALLDPMQTRLTIGGPTSNYRAYVLDSRGKMAMIGVPGELHLAGRTVARGYLNRPDLTAVRFLPNPFGQGKLYKTGDLVRWLPDGNLEFLGRIDRQVKLRGFRVELGEIESVLVAQPGVTGAVVVKHHERLVAFVTPSDVNVAALEESCPMSLPNYMIPAMIVAIDEFARTGTGKIDHKGLELVAASIHVSKSSGFGMPVSPLEQVVVAALADVLHVDVRVIGMNDDFFELGGDSLKAVLLARHLKSLLRTDVAAPDVLSFSTPQALARHLKSEKISPRSCCVPLNRLAVDVASSMHASDTSDSTCLFLVHGAGGALRTLAGLGQLVHMPCFGLQLMEEVPLSSIESMAEWYLAVVRSLQPTGGYALGGFSFGCSVAVEMAMQLSKAGESVQMIILLDPVHLMQPPDSRSDGANEEQAVEWLLSQFFSENEAKIREAATIEQKLSVALDERDGKGEGLRPFFEHLIEVLLVESRIAKNYCPQGLLGARQLFVGLSAECCDCEKDGSAVSTGELFPGITLEGPVRTLRVPDSTHLSMMLEPEQYSMLADAINVERIDEGILGASIA